MEDELEKTIDERSSDHSLVSYVMKKVPRPLEDRDAVTQFVWKAQGTGFLFVTVPGSSLARPLIKGVVRIEYFSAMKIIKINDGETRVEYVVRPDLGGNVPAFYMNFYMNRFVSYPTEIQKSFEKVRSLSNWDAKDGRAIGEALLIKVDAESRKVRPVRLSREEARVRALLAQYKGLKEACERWEWLTGMLVRVLETKLR
jgi:hypothetical protein